MNSLKSQPKKKTKTTAKPAAGIRVPATASPGSSASIFIKDCHVSYSQP